MDLTSVLSGRCVLLRINIRVQALRADRVCMAVLCGREVATLAYEQMHHISKPKPPSTWWALQACNVLSAHCAVTLLAVAERGAGALEHWEMGGEEEEILCGHTAVK